MDQYYGMLTDQEIKWIIEALDIVNEEAPCHINAIIRAQLSKKLTEEFLKPDKHIMPNIENKFIETIEIKH